MAGAVVVSGGEDGRRLLGRGPRTRRWKAAAKAPVNGAGGRATTRVPLQRVADGATCPGVVRAEPAGPGAGGAGAGGLALRGARGQSAQGGLVAAARGKLRAVVNPLYGLVLMCRMLSRYTSNYEDETTQVTTPKATDC